MVDFSILIARQRMARTGETDEAAVLAQVRAELAENARLRAENHGYLPEEGVPFFHALGVKRKATGAMTHGDPEEVHVVFEVRPPEQPDRPPVLRIAHGAVTGHESWYMDDYFLRPREPDADFWACAGGMGWASLVIPAAEIEKVFAWALPLRERMMASTNENV